MRLEGSLPQHLPFTNPTSIPTTYHNGNFTNRRGRGSSHRPGPCGCVGKTDICQLQPLVDAAAGGADTLPCTTCTCHWHTPVFGTVRPNNSIIIFICLSSHHCFAFDLHTPLTTHRSFLHITESTNTHPAPRNVSYWPSSTSIG